VRINLPMFHHHRHTVNEDTVGIVFPNAFRQRLFIRLLTQHKHAYAHADLHAGRVCV